MKSGITEDQTYPKGKDMSNIKYRRNIGIESIGIPTRVSPIILKQFSGLLKQRLLHLEPRFKFSSAMDLAFETYCSVYNDVIFHNRNNSKPIRFLLAAPTGAAKSVSSQLYLSQLPALGYSGLLILSKVKEAIAAVDTINVIAGKPVAACSYSTRGNHKHCPQRVDVKELKKYPIIVITHKMFSIQSRTQASIDKFRLYDNRQRDCVVIDEKISFQETISFTTKNISQLIGYVDHPVWQNVEKALDKLIAFNPCKTDLKSLKLHKDIGVLNHAMNIITSGDGVVAQEIDRKLNPDADRARRKAVATILDKVIYFANGHNSKVDGVKGKVRFSKTEDLTNRFGTLAILDATLHEDMIADAHNLNRSDIREIMLPDNIRNYQNATLHILHDKARMQSIRFMVKKNKEPDQRRALVLEYLEELYAIAEDGKLLVIVFKALEETFKKECKNDLVQFIHWGEHDSRNDLSHHTKVALLGWNRLPINKFIDDIDGITEDSGDYVAIGDNKNTDAQALQLGHIVSSTIQALNRSASRVCIDKYGNCHKVNWYAVDDGSDDSPFEDIVASLPGVTVKEWEPAKATCISTAPKDTDRDERMVKWLLTNHTGNKEVVPFV